MNDKIPECHLEPLYNNIALYYKQELDFILDKINNADKALDKILKKNISRKKDIYNLTFNLEEIKYSTNTKLSEKTISLNQTIKQHIKKIESTDDFRELLNHIEALKKELVKYRTVLEEDFSKKIHDVENKKLDDVVISHIQKISNYKASMPVDDHLMKLYCKTFYSLDYDQLINSYKSFFLDLTNFLKYKQNLKYFIPLNKNPILSLLKLGYFIKNGKLEERCICHTDILLLKAALAYNQDFKNLEILNESLNVDNDLLEIFFNKNKTNKKLLELRNSIEFGIFATSNFFSDFSIKNIFFPKIKAIKLELDNWENLGKKLFKLPELIVDPQIIYNKLISHGEQYNKCFLTEKNQNTVDTIIDSSPSKLLNEITNKYFCMLLNIATTINILFSKNEISFLNPFIEFENNLSKIILEMSNKAKANNKALNYYISHLNKELPYVNENYHLLLNNEETLIKNLSKNIIPDEIHKLNKFINEKNTPKYKDIIIQQKFTADKSDIKKSLKNINQDIGSNKIDKATEESRNITFLLLENIYYDTPSIVKIKNLPPSSHQSFQTMLQMTDSQSIANILTKQEEYWSM